MWDNFELLMLKFCWCYVIDCVLFIKENGILWDEVINLFVIFLDLDFLLYFIFFMLCVYFILYKF